MTRRVRRTSRGCARIWPVAGGRSPVWTIGTRPTAPSVDRHRTPSAGHRIAQVHHPSSLDDDVRIVEQALPVDRAEVSLAGTEDDRHDVHRDLIDQAERESLAADVACGQGDIT